VPATAAASSRCSQLSSTKRSGRSGIVSTRTSMQRPTAGLRHSERGGDRLCNQGGLGEALRARRARRRPRIGLPRQRRPPAEPRSCRCRHCQ
jgi:hypothetical protein